MNLIFNFVTLELIDIGYGNNIEWQNEPKFACP